MNDHYWRTRLGVGWFLCRPKMVIYKRWPETDAMIGKIDYVSHHLESLSGVIELTVLCAFVFKVGYFDAQIRETLLYKLEL